MQSRAILHSYNGVYDTTLTLLSTAIPLYILHTDGLISKQSCENFKIQNLVFISILKVLTVLALQLQVSLFHYVSSFFSFSTLSELLKIFGQIY